MLKCVRDIPYLKVRKQQIWKKKKYIYWKHLSSLFSSFVSMFQSLIKKTECDHIMRCIDYYIESLSRMNSSALKWPCTMCSTPHSKLRFCNESLLTHFCWSDLHKICCVVLSIFSEIKFKIQKKIHYILNDRILAGLEVFK